MGAKAVNIEAVLNAGTEYEKWLHRDLLLAGWCLTEDSADLKTVAPELVGEILDRLVAIEVGDTKRMGNKARNEGAEIIHRLAGTTFEEEIWSRLKGSGDAMLQVILCRFGNYIGNDKRSVKTLLNLLESNNYAIRSRATQELLKLGCHSREMYSELERLLRNGYLLEPCITVEQLNKLKKASVDDIYQLVSLLNDQEYFVHCGAGFALGQLSQNEIAFHALVQWIEEQPDDVPIGGAIDGLRSMIE